MNEILAIVGPTGSGKTEWGLRSYQDEPDSFSWGGQNVYDVFSLSEARALDGTYYKDW
jgi:general secretion pathway protein G